MLSAIASATPTTVVPLPGRLGKSKLRPLDTRPALSFKSKVLKRLHLFFYLSGLSSFYAWLRTQLKRESVATVLMYHSIPTASTAQWIDPCNRLNPDIFEAHMQFLAERCHVVSMSHLIQQIERGESIRQGTVVITFDDGYLDNLTVAAPILAKYSLPATIYLATEYIGAGRNQWVDTLYSAFVTRATDRLSLPELGIWRLIDETETRTAYQAIAHYLIEATFPERQRLLAEIDNQLAPTAYPPRLTLNWEEAQQIQRQYPNITLGVHTANHLDLRAHPEETDHEMTLSIQQFEQAMGYRPEHLAFPYNRHSLQVQKQVAAHLRSAVTVAPDPVVRSSTSPHALPRIEASESITMLKSWLDGGFPHLSQRLLKRSWTCPY